MQYLARSIFSVILFSFSIYAGWLGQHHHSARPHLHAVIAHQHYSHTQRVSAHRFRSLIRRQATHTAQIAYASGWKTTVVIATAYLVRDNQDLPHYHCPVYNGHTATGTKASRGTVAIDPNVFKFGTHFSIPGYGQGVGTDTGGMIIGHHIDLAMHSCKEAINWGARTVLISYK